MDYAKIKRVLAWALLFASAALVTLANADPGYGRKYYRGYPYRSTRYYNGNYYGYKRHHYHHHQPQAHSYYGKPLALPLGPPQEPSQPAPAPAEPVPVPQEPVPLPPQEAFPLPPQEARQEPIVMPPEVDIRMSDISVPITDIEQNMIVDANLFLAQQPVFDEALMPVEEEPAQFIIPNSLPAFPAVPVA